MSITLQKTVRRSQVNAAILIITIILAAIFGWSYSRQIDIYNAVKNAIPAPTPSDPKYLYTLYGNKDASDFLKWPKYTYATGDRVFVSDVGRVVVFDYNGKFIRSIRLVNKDTGNLIEPAGLLVVNNELYVADPSIKKVLVFGSDGQFKRYFTDKVLVSPAFIKFRDNKFFVYDTAKSKIKILDPQGALLKEFGEQGSGKGQLAFPYDLDVDQEGRIWVADSNNFRIQVFDQDGKLLNIWPEGSDNPDPVERKRYSVPRGISFDNKGFLWTAMTLGNYVAAVDPVNGEILKRLEIGSDEKDGLKIPTAVFIDGNNRLYVTESGSKRVLVYQL